MKYILRLLAFPFVLCIILIRYNYHAIKHAIGTILYGGEWITYVKDDRQTIHDIYNQLTKKKNDDFNEEVSFDKPKPVSLADDRVRICPYCNDEFVAHHKLQKYCPKKYGKRDYCKNRMKTITNNK